MFFIVKIVQVNVVFYVYLFLFNRVFSFQKSFNGILLEFIIECEFGDCDGFISGFFFQYIVKEFIILFFIVGCY